MNKCQNETCDKEATDQEILYGESYKLCEKHTHSASLGNWENIK